MKRQVLEVFNAPEKVQNPVNDSILSALGLCPKKIVWSKGILRNIDLAQFCFAIVVTGKQADSSELQAISTLRSRCPALPILLFSSNETQKYVVSALRAGIDDFVSDSCAPDELSNRLQRMMGVFAENKISKKNDKWQSEVIEQILIGKSPAMLKIKEYIRKIAATDASVLVTGETGTGKERVAELVHRYSGRYKGRFVSFNCAAIPENLVESELFGYKKGAFTGANSTYEGKLKIADGGTVFLDEVGDMNSTTQAKLLRVLEAKEVYPLGSKRPVPLDFRLVAATNRDLEEMIKTCAYRQDLYYRLNVAQIRLPPLREHREDIPLLIDSQIQQLSRHYDYEIKGVDPEVTDVLVDYDWPGNVRELKNIIEAAFIICPNRSIGISDIPEPFRNHLCCVHEDNSVNQGERDAVLAALLATNWNKSKAARKLNWSRMTLYRKMNKYHIAKNEVV